MFGHCCFSCRGARSLLATLSLLLLGPFLQFPVQAETDLESAYDVPEEDYLIDELSDFEYDIPLEDLTDSEALHYYEEAGIDDGSDEYELPGCTDPAASNFDIMATVDDFSCYYENLEIFGCTDAVANNYDSEATLDDGSCWYDTEIMSEHINDTWTCADGESCLLYAVSFEEQEVIPLQEEEEQPLPEPLECNFPLQHVDLNPDDRPDGSSIITSGIIAAQSGDSHRGVLDTVKNLVADWESRRDTSDYPRKQYDIYLIEASWQVCKSTDAVGNITYHSQPFDVQLVYRELTAPEKLEKIKKVCEDDQGSLILERDVAMEDIVLMYVRLSTEEPLQFGEVLLPAGVARLACIKNK